MAVRLSRRLVGFLPEVQSPTSAIPLRQKAAYTAVSLAIFLVGSHLPLYWTGVSCTPESAAANPLYWIHGTDASNSNMVMALGVIPLLVSEAVVHMLLYAKIVSVDNDAPQDRMLLDGVQKLLTTLIIAFGITIRDMLGTSTATKHSTMDTILIALQLFLGGVIVIYLDEVLKKGYGLVSDIPLFTTANICANIFWKAFSPYRLESCGGQRGDLHRGDVVSSIFHRPISRGDDELSAMCKALRHQEFPDMLGMVSSYTFFLIVLGLQSVYVVLPLRQHNAPMLQVNYTIRLSYLSFTPLLFQLLYTKFGENNKTVVNLLGKWKESMYFGQAVPVSGIAYYATTPPTLADVLRDPFYTFLYAVLLLMGCALFSTSFFLLCAYSDCYVSRLLGERQSVMVAQPDPVPHNRWRCYVAKVAFLVGLCIGTLKLLAGLIGVIGSGTGIMLAVTIIYSSFEGTGKTGAFGL